jgi:hypothetical protein
MAFSDPQDLKNLTAPTISASTLVLPRTSSATDFGQYKSADGMTAFTISHQYGKRYRRSARYDIRATVPDPLVTGISTVQSMSVYLVVDVPPVGFSQTTQKGYVDNLCAWLTATSYNNTVKFLGGES